VIDGGYDMRVIIRADGNREIAMGHIMRCLSVADALREAGTEAVFVTAGAETEELIRGRGYENYVLHTSFAHMEEELPLFREYFRGTAAELILVDSYYVTAGYMRELRTWTKTAYMDDMGLAWPVDLLINYNVYGNDVPYRMLYARENLPLPRLLLGGNYAPLRAEFRAAVSVSKAGNGGVGGKQDGAINSREVIVAGGAVGGTRRDDPVTDVLVTTGGGDAERAAEGLCRMLLEEKEKGLRRGIGYHIVCGPFFTGREALYDISGRCPEFVIHENVTNMSELMRNCDIAVSAAGGTMYELCCMRLPAVCFYFAENQRQMAEWFQERTEIQNAGDIRKDRAGVLERLLHRLDELERDGALRRRIRGQMERITDGRGALRIGEEIRRLAGSETKKGLL